MCNSIPNLSGAMHYYMMHNRLKGILTMIIRRVVNSLSYGV